MNEMEREEETRTGAEDEEVAGLPSLPEGVIANILSLTPPSDACRSSAVSRTFHTAAQSDIVWDRFLPNDLDVLISRRNSDHLIFNLISNSKKEIFFFLCDNPLLIDGGKKVRFPIPPNFSKLVVAGDGRVVGIHNSYSGPTIIGSPPLYCNETNTFRQH